MTDKAAFSGSYSDFKLIKSRSVAQVIVEIPVEAAESFVKVFGIPQPGSEKPVALALLAAKPKAEKTQTPGEHLRTRAVLICQDEHFQKWIGATTEDEARDLLCGLLGVGSRSEIATSSDAQQQFLICEKQYQTEAR